MRTFWVNEIVTMGDFVERDSLTDKVVEENYGRDVGEMAEMSFFY